MRLTPRKSEVAAVLAILESDNEFDTLEDMAKEVIETVFEEFTKRDWYAFGALVGSQHIGYGPLTSEHEVKKFAETIGLSGRGVKIYSPANALARIAE